MYFSMKQKKRYGCLGGLILLLAIVWGYFSMNHEEQPVKAGPAPVKVFTVGNEEKGAGTIYAGEIHSRIESDLSFQTGGKVLQRLVKAGDHVYRGQVLAVLDTRDLEQSVRSTQAQTASADSQLRLAAKNRQRYQQLLADGAVSQAVYDQYDQQYEAAMAAVEQSRAQQLQSGNQLGYSRLIADRDGIVTKLQLEPGQVVSAGAAVMTLADDTELEVWFSVPEQVVTTFSVGQCLSVRVGKSDQGACEAKVREISPLADADTRTFMVKAGIQGDKSQLRLGMTAKVSIARTDGLTRCVPLSALLEQPGRGKGVWLIRDGRLSFQPVKLGEVFKDQAAVCDGLEPGDKIVAAGVQRLQEGQLVGGMDK